jgi:uncharacterized protein YecE (DUF72 family)
MIALPLRVGTAGWSVPSRYAAEIPPGGSHLERYARRLNAVEINSAFHRPHQRKTYERWARSAPAGFRFSVKLPKVMTHEQRLADCGELLDRFVAEVAGLGDKLGVLLVQLPPNLHSKDGRPIVSFATCIDASTCLSRASRGIRAGLRRR